MRSVVEMISATATEDDASGAGFGDRQSGDPGTPAKSELLISYSRLIVPPARWGFEHADNGVGEGLPSTGVAFVVAPGGVTCKA